MLTIRTICITLLSAFALQANAWLGHSDFQRAERFIIPNSEFRICDQRSHDGSLQGAGGVGGLLAVNSYTSTNNSQFSISQLDETYFPIYDANGNVSEYINATDGTIAAHYDYSPFGKQIIMSGEMAQSFTHRFSTKPFCPYTGLIEYQYRKYHPLLGRWINRDPIGEHGDLNIYVTCENNAVNGFDLLGLKTWIIIYYSRIIPPETESSFKRAAITKKREIEKSKNFNKCNDKIIMKGILSGDNFIDTWNKVVNETKSNNEDVYEVHIYSHSGRKTLYLYNSNITEDEIVGLEKFNWDDDGSITLYGCNRGLPENGKSLATLFANNQGVKTIGQRGFTSFSTLKDERTLNTTIDNSSEDVYLWSYGFTFKWFVFGFGNAGMPIIKYPESESK